MDFYLKRIIMNKVKVKNLIKAYSEVLEKDYPTNEEFLITLGNIVRIFALQFTQKDPDLSALNPDDAWSIERHCNEYPEHIGLQLLLQSHVLIKLSERFKND